MTAALRIILVVLALGAGAQTAFHTMRGENGMTLQLEPEMMGGFYLSIIKGEERETIGHIGRTLRTSTYIPEEVEVGVSISLGLTNLTINTWYDDIADGHGIRISWNSEEAVRFDDCFDFGTKHWYGGPMQMNQIFPVEKAANVYVSYATRERDNGAIMERYWLNSAGEYYYVHPQVPLFVDYGNVLTNHLCFGAQIADPYSDQRNHTELTYDIWFLSDAKKAHMHAVANYLGKPSDVVDYRMVQHPIWSTWALFSRDIDETNLLEFAHQIIDNGFDNAQFEIDDLWEICYGSLTVNENKFSNFSNTVQEIKRLGFRVSLWIHPFINKDCEPWFTNALNDGYLVLTEDGNSTSSWWNNNGSVPGYIDFTNPAAAEWWSGRLRDLQQRYDIDSFKFDAGESSFSPQIPVQTGDIDFHPHHITQSYVKTCAQFGDMIEVRTGFQTQHLPVFVRMVDRDSIWGLNNGLATIITTTLMMNLAGYTLVLPDMIGGNGFNLANEDSTLPTRELMIRWVQANTFLPAMQYSFVPWTFDNETVDISRRYTQLHAAHADDIYAAMKASVEHGTPVNAPIWWLDPTDEVAQVIWDEYLLGDNILAAPVLLEGAVSRDVYLPVGTWFAEGDPEKVYEGPRWIRNYPAPLDTLPYFIRDGGTGAATTPFVSLVLVLFGLTLQIFGL